MFMTLHKSRLHQPYLVNERITVAATYLVIASILAYLIGPRAVLWSAAGNAAEVAPSQWSLQRRPPCPQCLAEARAERRVGRGMGGESQLTRCQYVQAAIWTEIVLARSEIMQLRCVRCEEDRWEEDDQSFPLRI